MHHLLKDYFYMNAHYKILNIEAISIFLDQNHYNIFTWGSNYANYYKNTLKSYRVHNIIFKNILNDSCSKIHKLYRHIRYKLGIDKCPPIDHPIKIDNVIDNIYENTKEKFSNQEFDNDRYILVHPSYLIWY